MKKLLCLALVLTLSLGLCAPLAASAGTLSDTGEKISFYWPWGAGFAKSMTSLEDNTMWKKIEEITGVDIEWVHPGVDNAQEHYNLLLAAQNLPDIVSHVYTSFEYPGGAAKAIDDGVYLPLNDLIKNDAPNYSALINSTPEFYKQACMDDGTIWGFAMLEDPVQGSFVGLVLRKDWMEELGLAMPTNLEELEQVLVAFRDQKNASAPLLLNKKGYEDESLALMASLNTTNTFYQIDGKVHFGPVEEKFGEYLKLMNKWFNEGLLDSQFSTRDDLQRETLIATDQSGVWNDGFWMWEYRRAKAVDPDKFAVAAIPHLPAYEGAEEPHLRQTNYNVRGNFTAITSNCANPDLAAKLIDFFYSEEGKMLFNYGVEGESYTMVDGEPVYTDLIIKNPDGLSIPEAMYRYMVHEGPFVRVWTREFKYAYTPEMVGAHDVWSSTPNDYMIPGDLLLSQTVEEGEELAMIMTDIETFVNERVINYITGIESLETLDNFYATIQNMNVERAIALKQAALDRYNAR